MQIRKITQVIFILVHLKTEDYVQLLGNHQVFTIFAKIQVLFYPSYFWLNKYSFPTASSGLQVFFLAKASSGFDLNTKLRNYRFWAITESASTQRRIYNDFYTRKAYRFSRNSQSIGAV